MVHPWYISGTSVRGSWRWTPLDPGHRCLGLSFGRPRKTLGATGTNRDPREPPGNNPQGSSSGPALIHRLPQSISILLPSSGSFISGSALGCSPRSAKGPSFMKGDGSPTATVSSDVLIYGIHSARLSLILLVVKGKKVSQTRLLRTKNPIPDVTRRLHARLTDTSARLASSQSVTL